MLIHSYVSYEFLHGVVSPLLKDSEGDHSDPNNYRPLTLSVVFSNLFEHALLLKIGHRLETDPLQFGYKRRHFTVLPMLFIRLKLVLTILLVMVLMFLWHSWIALKDLTR